MASKGRATSRPNAGGWKTCVRGHKYRGAETCPICWPGQKQKPAKSPAGKRVSR